MSCVGDVSLPSDVMSLPADCDNSVELPSSVASGGADMDIDEEAPSGVHADTDSSCDMPNAFDDDVDFDGDFDDVMDPCGVLAMEHYPEPVPTPAQCHAASLSGRHAFAEYFSPPRIAIRVREYGLDALLSLDIQTGWNFHDQRSRAQSILLLTQLAIVFVMLCPPCGAFSVLQHLWNFKKLHPSVVAHKVAMGTELVEHAMRCALVQYDGGRFFCI